MNRLQGFPWPSPPGVAAAPTWNGCSFAVAGRETRVLAYDSESSHWSEALTSLHETESGRNHPIDLASRRLAVATMRRLDNDDPVVLDVGCSSGFVLEDLRQALPKAGLIGADYLRDPLDALARRTMGLPLLQFDLRKCPLPDACVDGITCLNVLEHIDNEGGALSHLHRILTPGGILHLEVPANPALYDLYDEVLMHHRRYRMRDLVALARAAGFRVAKATHLGFLAYPAFWWVKRRNRRRRPSPPEQKARRVVQQIRATAANPFLSGVFRLETVLSGLVSFPWGIRCILVLRKT